jgi:hypothetical protein
MNRTLTALVAAAATALTAACAVPTEASSIAEIGCVEDALTIRHQVAPDAMQLPGAGLGYNTRTGQVAATACLDVDMPARGNQSSDVRFSSQMDTAQASSALSIDVDAKAHYGIYEGQGSFKMAREATSSSGSYTILLNASQLGPLLQSNRIALAADKAELRKSDPATFLRTCGDQVVTSIQYGSRLNIAYRVSFASDELKQEMTGSLSASAKFAELSTKLSSASSSQKKGITISLSATQVGGDPSQLTRVIDPKSAVTCSGDNLDACIKLAEVALTYASDTYPKQFSATSAYAPLSFSTAPYAAVGLSGVDYPEAPAAIVTARKKLQTAFDTVVAVRSLADVRATNRAYATDEVKAVQAALDADNAALQTAVPVCFDAVETAQSGSEPEAIACVAAVKDALAKVHSERDLRKQLDGAVRTFYGKSLALRDLPNACLDLHHGKLDDFSPVGSFTCNQSNPQRWSYSVDGRIRNIASTNACLDIERSGVAEGTKVGIFSCDKTEQTWTLDSQGRLRGTTGMCVTLTAPTKDATLAQATMQTCRDQDTANAYQHFVLQ